MPYSELECQQAWESVSRAGSRAERIERNRRWIEYFGTVFKRQENASKGEIDETFKKEFPLDVTSFLMQEKVLTSSSSVLDIAGTGALRSLCRQLQECYGAGYVQDALDIL